jgi:hypothetical protein
MTDYTLGNESEIRLNDTENKSFYSIRCKNQFLCICFSDKEKALYSAEYKTL